MLEKMQPPGGGRLPRSDEAVALREHSSAGADLADRHAEHVPVERDRPVEVRCDQCHVMKSLPRTIHTTSAKLAQRSGLGGKHALCARHVARSCAKLRDLKLGACFVISNRTSLKGLFEHLPPTTSRQSSSGCRPRPLPRRPGSGRPRAEVAHTWGPPAIATGAPSWRPAI